jgi:hypothetical protein
MFIDGVQQSTVANQSGKNFFGNTGNFRIGKSSPAFPGLIDDVRIYNRALSAAEVTAMYDAAK